MKKSRLAISLFLVAFLLLFFWHPKESVASLLEGASLWFFSVFPVLFPFFLCCRLLTDLNFFSLFDKFFQKLTGKLFGVPAASGTIALLGWISGSPMGAKLTQDFFEQKLLSPAECKKTVLFTSTVSPLFAIGTVGGIFFACAQVGWVVFLSNLGSAILLGFFFRKKWIAPDLVLRPLFSVKSTKNILSDAMVNALLGVLTVGGFICIFSVLTEFLQQLPILSGLSPMARSVLSGLLEVTKGAKELAASGLPLGLAAVICSGFVSFGGCCILLQNYCFLQSCDISLGFLTGHKLLQAAIALALSLPLSWLFQLF